MIQKKSPRKKNIRWASGSYKHSKDVKRFVFISHNFSDIEDAKTGAGIINELTTRAGKAAAKSAKKAGLPRIFIRNNQLITVNVKGAKQVIKKRPDKAKAFYIKYNPSTVLHEAK